MLIADTYLGNSDDPAVGARLDDADTLRVVLDDTDRRRSRVRTETECGRDLGIVVARELADGDVLKTEDGRLVVVDLATVEALVIDFADAEVSATDVLKVGHALGNRHWDLAIRSEEALFPVVDTRERTEATVADLLPEGTTTRFERISPTTFDDSCADHSHHDGPSSVHDDGEHVPPHDYAMDHSRPRGHFHDCGDHTNDHGVDTVREGNRD